MQPHIPERILRFHREGGRLVLDSPAARNRGWALGLFLVGAIPWSVACFVSVPSPYDWIAPPWLGRLAGALLPDPSGVPLLMGLAALAFFALGMVILGHRITATLGPDGVNVEHGWFRFTYHRVTFSCCQVREITLRETGHVMRNGEPLTLYSVELHPYQGRAETLADSLPGEAAAQGVLERVRQACPVPPVSPDSPR